MEFCEILCWRILLQPVKEIQVWLKSDTNIRYFTWWPEYVFM